MPPKIDHELFKEVRDDVKELLRKMATLEDIPARVSSLEAVKNRLYGWVAGAGLTGGIGGFSLAKLFGH